MITYQNVSTCCRIARRHCGPLSNPHLGLDLSEADLSIACEGKGFVASNFKDRPVSSAAGPTAAGKISQPRRRFRDLGKDAIEIVRVGLYVMRKEPRPRAQHHEQRFVLSTQAHPGWSLEHLSATPAGIHGLLLPRPIEIVKILRGAAVAIKDRVPDGAHF